MKTTRTAFASLGTVLMIVGCSHLGSDGGKLTDTHVLTLKHGSTSDPNQSQHRYRRIEWWLNEGTHAGFGLNVKSNDWIEWHNPKEPCFAIAVPRPDDWKPASGFSWLNIPNLGTWPAVATTNGRVRLQFRPNENTTHKILYRIAIAPGSDVYAMEAPQSNYCDVDIISDTIVWGGGFTNPVLRRPVIIGK
jgi:hypothetical protein